MKLCVFPNDPLKEYFKKGEIKDRYFNPNNIFNEIHVISFTDSEIDEESIKKIVDKQGDSIHKDCTYVCIEGPRFSTKAESKFYRTTGADIIGMTLVPECQLAREAQMCYASISTVTDYDVWAEKPVTAKLSKNVEKTKRVLTELIDKIPKTRSCSCAKALEEAEF